MVKMMNMKFNEIITRNDLADFLNIERKTLTNVLYINHVESYYHSFEIPKKSGGLRKIDAPSSTLKYIQRRLSRKLYIYRHYICEKNGIKINISHAFEKRKSIITNSAIHKNKRYIINVDLKDFFESFHFGRVRGYFVNNKYFKLSNEVATVIAQLSCYEGKLPQGAPTSPIITNLICNVMDYKLLSLAKKFRLDYTRYADDLTFSTNDRKIVHEYENFYKKLNDIITDNGFIINSSKTRFVFKDSRQIVTGLVVNKKVNVDYRYYKMVRAMAQSLYTTGKFYIDGEQGNLDQLEGKLSFINEIEHYNNKTNGENFSKFYRMSAREKELQKFIFYKYFYANDKPVIVTEGKTDILYIKSALKALYEDYPSLIEKDSKGEFKFKVSFFKRSKRIRFFLNMSQDGADAMKHLYSFFSETDNKLSYPNYLKKFKELTKNDPNKPVILVFDNEIKSKTQKPLKVFLNFCGLKGKTFDIGGQIKLIDDSNLYLATHQLVRGKSECEIEDLFDSSVLNHQINGKKFSKNSKFDTNKYYGKDHFSKYISENYKSIDFTNFKPLLNAINEIVLNY